MTLTKSPAGRSLKVFASAAGSYAGALLFLGLLEFIAFVWNSGSTVGDIFKIIFGAWYVGIMFIIVLGTLLFLTISSIITYVHVCKEKQKKFLIFALPGQVVSFAFMILSIILLVKSGNQGERNVACWMNIIAGIVALYLCVVSTVFKHITWNKAKKSNK
ncbi:MAG: hypothetical protein ACOQNV_03030 [Mycoplasmoidaceae bacterium]